MLTRSGLFLGEMPQLCSGPFYIRSQYQFYFCSHLKLCWTAAFADSSNRVELRIGFPHLAREKVLVTWLDKYTPADSRSGGVIVMLAAEREGPTTTAGERHQMFWGVAHMVDNRVHYTWWDALQ